MPRSRTLVEVSSTYIEVEGLGVVTVGLLKADLYTSELTDAAVASVPGLTAETIGGRKIEVATADGNPATFCWNQSRHESFCVGGDMLADGNGAVDRLDNISRAIVGAIAATK